MPRGSGKSNEHLFYMNKLYKYYIFYVLTIINIGHLADGEGPFCANKFTFRTLFDTIF